MAPPRRLVGVALALGVALLAPACVGWRISREFFAGPAGATPAAIEVVSGEWRVGEAIGLAAGMPALEQLGGAPAGGVNLCLVGAEPFEEGALEVRLEAQGGSLARGGGIAWAIGDGSRFAWVEVDLLAARIRFGQCADGQRDEIASATIESGTGWRVLRVDVSGDEARATLDGQLVLEAESTAFEGPGRVGLFTSADARTRFADFVAIRRR
ncbi:MAG: hypothetical protein JNL90_17205 [Planctomycetes bacterium]|nr:hypothetical protein [Planctomycetota bacterium]